MLLMYVYRKVQCTIKQVNKLYSLTYDFHP